MVSLVHPPEADLVSRIAYRFLGLPDNPTSVGASVIELEGGMGYSVTVVTLEGPLTAYLIRVDAGGHASFLLGEDQA